MSGEAPPAQDGPAARFRDRQRRWRALVAKFYARHAEVEPHAALLMGWLFDQAERVRGSPMREYHLTASEPYLFVRLNADQRASKPWSWIAPSHDLEGRGFYELWALRWDVAIGVAAEQIWCVIRSSGGAR